MTPAGIEPATFRFVAQHLNHCASAVSSPMLYQVSKYPNAALTVLQPGPPLCQPCSLSGRRSSNGSGRAQPSELTGPAMAQAISRRPVTTQTQARSQASLFRIVVEKVAVGRVSVQLMRVSHATCRPYSDPSFITDATAS